MTALIATLPLSTPMPENEPVAIAHPSLFLFDDNDGDGFSDFTFAPFVNSHPLEDGDGDEWGDFVACPVGSQTVDPPHPDPAAATAIGGGSKSWERPREALLLSLFGEEEETESGAPDLLFTNRFSFPNPMPEKEARGLGVKGDLTDLIINLAMERFLVLIRMLV